MFKFMLCLSFAVAVAASHYDHEHFHSPIYSYKYSVNDPRTHDMKNHWETRDGDKVFGSYRLVEPDGSLRVVYYTADKHNGFRAVVTREKQGHRQVSVHGKKETNHGHGAVSKVQHFAGNYKHFTSKNNFGSGQGEASVGTGLRFVSHHY